MSSAALRFVEVPLSWLMLHTLVNALQPPTLCPSLAGSRGCCLQHPSIPQTRCLITPLMLLLPHLHAVQDAVSASSDAGVLSRISQIITYLRETGSGKGSKKAERDSNYIRSILAGVNPAAQGEQQVTGDGAGSGQCVLGVSEQQYLKLSAPYSSMTEGMGIPVV